MKTVILKDYTFEVKVEKVEKILASEIYDRLSGDEIAFNAPEGWEFTGEFRIPVAGEVCYGTDRRVWSVDRFNDLYNPRFLLKKTCEGCDGSGKVITDTERLEWIIKTLKEAGTDGLNKRWERYYACDHRYTLDKAILKEVK